jgi:two-component system sensor histidine kinase YesM
MKMRNALLLFCFAILSYKTGLGQNTAGVDSATTYNNARQVNAASAKLLMSIRENKSNEEIAGNYFDLAEALTKTGEYIKAEIYMNKAIEFESGTKKKKNLADYYRALAWIQELQNKFQIASDSYKKAADLSNDSLQKQLNRNDAIRLLHKSSPQDELQYLNQNASLLSNSSNKHEQLQNYTQMANANIALNQNGPALDNFRSALNTVDSNSENSVLIKSDMVNLMVASNDYQSAIALQKDLVKKSQTNSSVETQVAQLRNLSALYFKLDSTNAGLGVLQNAYELAVAKGNLKEAKKSLVALADFYEKNKQHQQATQLYSDFISHLDNLIARDSSLIDKRLFLVNEGKIAELEQQQTLKDELIQRKNRSNFVLVGSVILLTTLLLLIIKAWFSIRKRNKQIALQSLRREMNPHFIFNSLNSVNQFIANNNERKANKYLTSYSNLMRNIMENSNKDYVTLNVEIDQLKKYLELEKLRFPDKFDYEFEIDHGINTDAVMVPNMIIQPNLENAIWHGLRYKESSGLLRIKFYKENNKTIVTIDDNGIGLTESKKIKTKNQKLHESLGLKNVQERIRLLNDIYKSNIHFELKEKTSAEGGVLVQIEW